MALGLAEELLRLAQREHNSFLHFQAHFEMGFTLFFRGALVSSRSHFERAMAFYDPQQHRDRALQDVSSDSVVACLSHLALNLSVLGYPDQAMTRLCEALTRAQELGHPYSQVYALIHAVTIHQHRREVQAVQERAEAMALCEEQEFAHWLAAGRFYRGWALVAQAHTEEGMAQMRQGLTRVSHARGPMGPYTRALWAEAHATIEQTAEGLAVLAEVLEEVDQGEGRFYAAELHRLKGELLLHQAMTKAPQVEACFQQALALARHSQAKWWELRAAMSLSRLWQRQDKRDTARQLLAEVYGWFTEGFDTADLQEARALLHELRGG